MIVKNNFRKSITFLAIILILCGCAPKVVQTEEILPSETASFAPTATQQPTQAPTSTSVPTPTPTTPPLQPAALSEENIQNIQLITTTEFFQMGTLNSADWSPDGKLLVVKTSKDLQLVDSETLEILYTIQDYDFVHFLDNGNLVLRDDQGLPLILDSQSYVLDSLDLEIPSNESGYDINAYAISYDGLLFADISIANTIRLTNIETGESTEFVYQPDNFMEVQHLGATFSPDSNYLYFNQGEGLSVFDCESHQLITRESEMNGLPDFSPDSKRLVSLTHKYVSIFTSVLGPWYDLSAWFSSTLNDEENIYYNWMSYSFVQDSSELGILYQGSIYNYSTNEQRLTATIIIYDTNDGSVVDSINDIPSTTFDMGFSPDGTRFFTLSRDGYIKIWQTSDSALLVTSESYRPSTEIIVTPDGDQFAYTLGGTIYMFDSRNGEMVLEFTEPNHSETFSITFQGNKNIAITSGGQTDTYEIATGEWIRNYPLLGYCIFNQTGTTLICSSGDFELYDASTGRALIKVRPSSSYRYAVSNDGAYTAYCNNDSETVFLYDNQKGTQIQFLKYNNQPACGAMAFSADGHLLVSSIGAVWQIPDGDLVMELQNSGSGSVSIAPNNKFVLIYPGIYSLEDGSLLTTIESNIDIVYSAWFLPNGYDLVLRGSNELQFWGVLE